MYSEELNNVANERLAMCKACPFAKTIEGGKIWCGTPITGDTVEHEGKTYQTCGCNMNLKVKFKWLSCPVGKWSSTINLTDEVKSQVKNFIHGLNPFRITTQEANEVYNSLEKLTGVKIKPCYTCGTVTNSIIQEIKNGFKLEDSQIEQPPVNNLPKKKRERKKKE